MPGQILCCAQLSLRDILTSHRSGYRDARVREGTSVSWRVQRSWYKNPLSDDVVRRSVRPTAAVKRVILFCSAWRYFAWRRHTWIIVLYYCDGKFGSFHSDSTMMCGQCGQWHHFVTWNQDAESLRCFLLRSKMCDGLKSLLISLNAKHFKTRRTTVVCWWCNHL